MTDQRQRLAWSIAAGLGLAALFTITPLTVCVVAAGALILPRFGRGLPVHERRWLWAIVTLALVAHVIAIAVVFARNIPNHDDQFAGAASGDEAYTMSRALRTREIMRGSPVSLYDYFVAFDEYGSNSYVTLATAAQIVFGPTPYSLRLLNTLLFTIGALLLFRLCRDAFGALPALGGLLVLLFWPSLFAWSISLLKESLYFLLSAVILTAAAMAVRARRWVTRGVSVAAVIAAAALIQGLRPAALPLAAAGLAIGFLCHLVSASPRRLALAMAAAAVLAAVALPRPAVSERVIQALEGTAKTHTGHVFTVGHDYKLLDAGFYMNPQAPAASTLTLTRDEAARYVVRALGSFVVTPAPWQLRSSRELAYLPEQLAWYGLVLLLPLGIAAGFRRDRLVTCLLVGFVAPTAIALALTNGNVGTLLRLRGLVVPFLSWVSLVGFCGALGTLGQKETMTLIDNDGRLFGRINLFDAALAGAVVVLIPLAYGTYLLFRTPMPQISSVTRVPITQEERRVAGGNRLTAKLKIRGSGLRPMLRATIGARPALGFIFENPNSADVMAGLLPPGAHDLILYDGVQEVARLPASVVIESTAPPRIAGVGALINLDQATAAALVPGRLSPGGSPDAIVKLGTARVQTDGTWQRPAEILLQCDPDPNGEGCAVGGIMLASTPLPIVKLTGPAGAPLSFALTELLPQSPPTAMTARIRFTAAPEVLMLVRPGDRDDSLDERAAVVVGVGGRRTDARDIDVVLRLGIDGSEGGSRYRGQTIKAGAPFTLTTERYVLAGTVLSIDSGREGAAK